MDYRQTLEYIFEKLPMYHRIGQAAYKSDLNNIIWLADHLANPHKSFRTIHIAGTNGKGSVSHMLASVLQEAGYKTGLYTSPHLIDFRERIRMNGQMIPEGYVTCFVEQVKHFIESVQPSFFEITVGMAFSYFANQHVDVAVIETGLGGRLDSTNIIEPDLSIITNISWDHTNLLGDTLEKIAFEKAGIIKRGIPVVIGQKSDQTKNVFLEKAAEEKAPLYFAEDQYKAEMKEQHAGYAVFEIISADNLKKVIESDLAGNYQGKNIAALLTSVDILNKGKYCIPESAVINGIRNTISNTVLRGRWDVINENPVIVCDIAHNEGAITEVINQLKISKYEHLHVVFGMSGDKDIDKVLALLPATASYYFAKPSVPRGMDANELAAEAQKHGLKGTAFCSVKDAMNEARKNAGNSDMILITGSAFVVADAMEFLPGKAH
jgi:dihydrofolate synthase/folylpolyglutamate synthase